MNATSSRERPYPGLRAFDEQDARWFFGRDTELRAMLAKISVHRLTALVGHAGCGKSSLLQAGLFPRLRKGHATIHGTRWRIAHIPLLRRPIVDLAAGLCRAGELHEPDADADLASAAQRELAEILEASPRGLADAARNFVLGAGEQLLVAIDHFERLWQEPKTTADERENFVALLLDTAAQRHTPITIVLGLRSEALGECAQFHGLSEALHPGQVLVPAMPRDAISAAIRKPMTIAGAAVAPEFTERVLDDHFVAAKPDLRRLQHLLYRAHNHWRADGAAHRALGLTDYEAVGPLDAALARHLESIWAELGRECGETGALIAEKLFRGLTQTERDGAVRARVLTVGELLELSRGDTTTAARVVDAFGRPGRAFIQLGPEGWQSNSTIHLTLPDLPEHWPRLQEMARDELALARRLESIDEAARRARSGEGGLWRDRELDAVLQWRARHQPAYVEAQRYGIDIAAISRFLDESSAENQARASRERDDWAARADGLDADTPASSLIRPRNGQGMGVRWAVAVCVVLLLGAGTAGGYIWLERERTTAELARIQAEHQATQRAEAAARAELLRVEQARKAAELQRAQSEAEKLEAQRSLEAVRAERLAAEEQRLQAQAEIEAEKVAVENDRRSTRGKIERTRALALTAIARRSQVQPLVRIALLREAPEDIALSMPGWHALAARALADLGMSDHIAHGHVGELLDVAFSPDGQRIATASSDTTAQLWSVDGSGEPIELGGHQGAVRRLAFSSDGSAIATASADGTARIWTLAAPGEARVLEGHLAALTDIAFSPDNSTLWTASEDGSARSWRVASGARGARADGHEAPILDLDISPDGRHMVTTARDGSIRGWALPDATPTRNFVGPSGRTDIVRFSPNNHDFAGGGEDGVVRIWGLDEASPRVELTGHRGSITSIDFSPDSSRLLSAATDESARVWPTEGNGPAQVLAGHRATVTIARFSPDATRAATGGSDGTIRVWAIDDPAEPVVLAGHRAAITAMAFNPTGSHIVSASRDRDARVWKHRGHAEPLVLRGTGEALYAVEFSPNGQSLATGGEDASVWLWPTNGHDGPRELRGHTAAITGVAFDGPGQRLISGSEDDRARIWDLASGQAGVVLEGHGDDVTAVDFHPNDLQVATGCDDGIVRVWSIEGGSPIAQLSGHQGGVAALAYSPDGQHIAVAARDGVAQIWPSDGQGTARTLPKHAKELTSIRFSPDGSQLATTSADGVTRIWDVATLKLAGELHRHARDVAGVAFEPTDGQTLATGSYDHTARIWGLDDASTKLELRGHRAEIYGLAFAPDGQKIATVSQDGRARIWSVHDWYRRLWQASAYCIPPADRMRMLSETDEEALSRHAACEAEVQRRRDSPEGFPPP